MSSDEEIQKPHVPIDYVRLSLDQAAERGLDPLRLLRAIGVAKETLEDPAARITLAQYGLLIYRVLSLTGDASLGYEFGLRVKLTSHGFAGFGLMNNRTLREAGEFGLKYLQPLRTPGFSVHAFKDGDQAVVELRESVPYGPLRQYCFDMGLVGMTHIPGQFVDRSEMELWFDTPEPPHYAEFRDRLPRVRFDAPANQLRLPIAALDRHLDGANPVTAKLVAQQCEREIAMLGENSDTLARVRAILADASGGYPKLEAVASRLATSTRTLKRRLQSHGFGFRELVDEARRRDSVRLLHETRLSVDRIAAELGYTARSNFTRAFRAWTGTTPGDFRKRKAAAEGKR